MIFCFSFINSKIELSIIIYECLDFFILKSKTLKIIIKFDNNNYDNIFKDRYRGNVYRSRRKRLNRTELQEEVKSQRETRKVVNKRQRKQPQPQPQQHNSNYNNKPRQLSSNNRQQHQTRSRLKFLHEKSKTAFLFKYNFIHLFPFYFNLK